MGSDIPVLPVADRSEEFELFRLPDGRDLAFLEWGDPNGYPAFYFHGTPSSRLEGALAHVPAERHGFRLIATDRPGLGRSTFQPGRKFRDWPVDICNLADSLGIDKFGVVGHSGAGPHLFACGACIDPARLQFIGALGPWGPPTASDEIRASMNALDRFYARVASRMPWIMHAAFAPLGWTARHAPKTFFRLMESAVSEADKLALQQESFLVNFRRMEFEAFRQSSRGGAHEALICFRPWDFDVSEVRVPTYIWLGANDIFVSEEMGAYLERTIPDVELHLIPGKGHLNVENWDDILAACAKHKG